MDIKVKRRSSGSRLIYFVRQVRIFFLKRKARKHYAAHSGLQESYDCGNSMIDTLTGGKLGHHRNMFNIAMDQLSLIDPSNPKARL